jgi:hypothetical protein
MVDFAKLSRKLEKETMATNRNNNDRPRDDRRGSRPSSNDSKMKICYSITKRENQDRAYWTRIGVAFVNSDGSLNVKLDCLPVSGELHIRDYVPNEDRDSGDDDSEGE